jgi:Dna[CI] antecedent, DciA
VPRVWREPERIGGAVRRQLARFGDAGRLGEVVEAWPRAVGGLVARNAWPARIARDGTLVVNTKDAVWAFELGHRSAEILGRLDKGLKAAKFVPGPIPETPPEVAGPAERAAARATPEQRIQGAELAAGIEDEELRERVARAAAASLARAADGRSVW